MITINRSKKPINGNESYDFELKGLSTDEKPIIVDGYAVGENSIFFEVDTGKFYYFSAGEWALISSGGSGGGGDLNTVTATIVNNSESTKSYAFYGYDYINGSLPDTPVLALQVKNGEYYVGTYSNEVSAGGTDTAEIVMLGDVFYFDANQNAQVTGDASIAWDDVVESYIVTATGDFTLTYE